MPTSVKRIILTCLGIILSVGVPTAVTLLYFPIWYSEGSEKLLSGGILVILILCAVPLIKLIKKLFATPSAPVMWLAVFLIFVLISKIADEITVISFWGFISNTAGSLFFKLAEGAKE